MTEPAPEAASSQEIPSATPPPAVPPAKPEKGKAEKKPLSLSTRIFRWFLWFLILFGGGMVLSLFLFYIPQSNELSLVRAELNKASQQASSLQEQLDSKAPLETQNQDLQTQLKTSTLHVNLLSARLDVALAQYYLAKNDPANARVSLSKTDATLANLGTLLPAGQSKVVSDMQSRLKLALGEIESNAYAAQSDLDVLTKALLELENAYFSKP
jgi:hypothetical protein